MTLKEAIEARIARGLPGYGDYNKDPSTWPRYTRDGLGIIYFTPFLCEENWFNGLDNDNKRYFVMTGEKGWQEYTEPKKPLKIEVECEWKEERDKVIFPIIRPYIGDIYLSNFIGKRTKMILTEIVEDA